MFPSATIVCVLSLLPHRHDQYVVDSCDHSLLIDKHSLTRPYSFHCNLHNILLLYSHFPVFARQRYLGLYSQTTTTGYW